MDDYQELIERLRSFEIDHEPDGWPGVRMRQISAMCDAIESLLSENGRLKAELAKYRDAPVVVWRTHPFDYGIGHEGVYASTHFKEQSEVWNRKGWRVEELIVKPGEEK